MSKGCYVAGCDRWAGWIVHDDEVGDMDSCAEHAFYDDWEIMQAAAEPTPPKPPTPHWAVISAGNIVMAQGYCLCGDPSAPKHSIIASGPSD